MGITKEAKEIIDTFHFNNRSSYAKGQVDEIVNWVINNPKLLEAEGLIQAQKNDDRLQWNKDAASYMQTIAALSREIADYRSALEELCDRVQGRSSIDLVAAVKTARAVLDKYASSKH